MRTIVTTSITSIICIGISLAVAASVSAANFDALRKIAPMKDTLQTIAQTKVAEPKWYQEYLRPKPVQQQQPPKNQPKQDNTANQKSQQPNARVITYTVETRGALRADIGTFKSEANATLNDSRGWPRLGLRFQEVASGGSFVLVLSQASQVPSFSQIGCSSDLSCRVGQYVIINEDRWNGATTAWNASGASLADYRRYVVNHETGHWLGHDHTPCGGASQAAPVMLQQSITLQGCRANPWPLESELWTAR